MSIYENQNAHCLSHADDDVLSSFDDFLTNNNDKNPWNFRAELFSVDENLESFDPTAIDENLDSINGYPPSHSTSSTNDEALKHPEALQQPDFLGQHAWPSQSPPPSKYRNSSPTSTNVQSEINSQDQAYSHSDIDEQSQQYSSLHTVVSENRHLGNQPLLMSTNHIASQAHISNTSVGVNPDHTIHNHEGFLENSQVTYRSDDQTCIQSDPSQRGTSKPPTTANITLEDLKQVFDLERPKAEKRLNLKRTTFSNLSRHFGISKWPYRTIRDVRNRQQANDMILQEGNISKEKRRKLLEQQRNLEDVINLIYSDPTESRDSNTLAVLLKIVESRRKGSRFG